MEGKLCKFCEKDACYACPKCNAFYCSLPCYQSRSHSYCSEKFYESQVKEQLDGLQCEESKAKMMAILKRQYEEPEDDEFDSDDEEDLEDRMKGIDLDDTEAVWEKLTQNEREELLKKIKEGDIDELIRKWEAWWETEKNFIREVTETEASQPLYAQGCPIVLKLPALSTALKEKLSPYIANNILNILTSYVWIARFFNGDYHDDAVNASEGILSLSQVLCSDVTYESPDIATTSPIMQSQSHDWLQNTPEFHNCVAHDVATLVKGPGSGPFNYYILSALSDLHKLFVNCKKALSSPKTEPKGKFEAFASAQQEVPKKYVSKSRVKSQLLKLELYIKYVHEFPEKFCII